MPTQNNRRRVLQNENHKSAEPMTQNAPDAPFYMQLYRGNELTAADMVYQWAMQHHSNIRLLPIKLTYYADALIRVRLTKVSFTVEPATEYRRGYDYIVEIWGEEIFDGPAQD